MERGGQFRERPRFQIFQNFLSLYLFKLGKYLFPRFFTIMKSVGKGDPPMGRLSRDR
jgi:hypothetical protein